jgi:hypothetical protein
MNSYDKAITILKVQEHTRNGSPSSHLGNGEKTSEQSFEDLLAQNIQAESERRERIEALTEASYRLLKEEKGKEEEAEEKLRAALLSTQPTLHFASPDNHPCSLHQHCPTMRLPVFHIHIRPRFLSYKMC